MKRYALVVGIANYQNDALEKLEKPPLDAEAVAQELEKHGDFQEVTRLPANWLSSSRAEVAEGELTSEELTEKLRYLLLEQAKNSEAVIYFSGHGIALVSKLSGKQEGFLATSDCEIEIEGGQVTRQKNGISLRELNDLIREAKASSLVVLLDCCHAGSLLENDLLKQTLTAFNEKDYFLIAACRSQEKAYEDEKYSIFTEALLKGLSEEQAGTDGKISCDRLFAVIDEELKRKGQEPIRLGYGRSITLVNYPQRSQGSVVEPLLDGNGELRCPYQGLLAFTKAESPFFFGRQQIVEELSRKLEQRPFVPLIGASGNGKSSVVLGGLVPWLEEWGWQVLEPIKPGFKPLIKLETALLSYFPDDEQLLDECINHEASEGLKLLLERFAQGRHLLVVDQFEELFTIAQQQQRDRFIDLITKVADFPDTPLAVIIMMRADFLEPCLQYDSLRQLIEDEAKYLPPLLGTNLIDAICEPAKCQGYEVTQELLNKILEDIKQEPGFLPLLEFALTQLWEHRDEEGHRLTLSQYRQLGRVSGALEQHAEKIYCEIGNKFGKEGLEWVKRICLSLVRTGLEEKDTRQRLLKAEVLSLAKNKFEDQKAIGKVLEKLIKGRLLVSGKNQKNQAWVDLSHEALIEGWERFAKWLKEDRELRRLIERVRDARRVWLNNNKSYNFVMFGGILEQVLAKWSQIEPYVDTEVEKFVLQSLKESLKRSLKNMLHDDRINMRKENLKRAFLDHLFFIQGTNRFEATDYDYYMALAYTVRDRLLYRFLTTFDTYKRNETKLVCYFSTEWLIGRHLENNLVNLGIYDRIKEAIGELELDLDELLEQEPDPGLGSGGLGRLAACFMDSLASLEIPAIGYGIRYEFGIFNQFIQDGWQVEVPDNWLRFGNPWELPRPDETVEIKLGGTTQTYLDEKGNPRVSWIPERTILAIPHDTPVPGYQTNTVNPLRLWKAEASEQFNFEEFNAGNYDRAVEEKMNSETISKVLYPNDNTPAGRELRFAQQYFFVSASLQDLIKIHLRTHKNLDDFHEKIAIQINDTHPAIAVVELMRLLIDEHGMDWEHAWSITEKTFAYTHHTLLPEALEKLPVSMLGKLLPRHMEIIYELNHRFLEDVRTCFPHDDNLIDEVSLIEEAEEKKVRMAHLTCIGSHAINGVAALHTELLKKYTLGSFAFLWPEKFFNKTNGVTPRRWMLLSNPKLSQLITEKIDDGWLKDLSQLRALEKYTDDSDFVQQWQDIKKANKERLAQYIFKTQGIQVDTKSIFDILVKRIHEYKRHHLCALYIITLYNRLKRNPNLDIYPRTFIFGGKAAPSYFMAKLIIKLINNIAHVVNQDLDVRGRLKVVFLPNFNVSLGQRIYPAADLSEQIFTAGKEASGTSNMKFAMNGALTIGTLNGANIEIREEVDAQNFFLFGLSAEEVTHLRVNSYNPMHYYENNSELKEVLDRMKDGYFSSGNKDLFKPIVDSLLYDDPYMLLADYNAYVECQKQVEITYQERAKWTRMSILNVSRIGKFSSDRAIKEYCQEIWDIKPVRIELAEDIQLEKLEDIYSKGELLSNLFPMEWGILQKLLSNNQR